MRARWLAALFIAWSSIPLAAERFVAVRPDPKGFAVERDIVYRSTPDLKYDLYRPLGRAAVPVLVVANVTGADYRTWPGYIGWAEAGAAAGFAVVVYQASPAGSVADFDAVMDSLRQ